MRRLRTISLILIALIPFGAPWAVAPASAAPSLMTASLTADVSGLVRSSLGGPLATAITLVGTDGWTVAVTQSDASGNYAFLGIEPGRYTVEIAGVPGIIDFERTHPRQYLGGTRLLADAEFFEVATGSTRRDITVIHGVRFSGTLTGGEDQVGEIRFEAWQDGWLVSSSLSQPAPGRYRTEWMLPGSFTLKFTANDDWVDQVLEARADAGSDVALDVELPRAGWIVGSFTRDHYRGSSRPSVLVYSADRPDTPVASVPTFQDRFEVGGLPAGDYLVRFFEYGPYAHLVEEWWPDAPDATTAQAVTVHAGERTSVSAEVRIGTRLLGTVGYRAGQSQSKPAPGSVIHVYERGAGGALIELDDSPVVADFQGRWEYPKPLPDADYAFRYGNPAIDWMFPDQMTYVKGVGSESEPSWAPTLVIGDWTRLDWRLEFAEIDTRRVAGATRWSTAAAVSREVLPDPQGPVVYLANGMSFADALSAGPAAIVDDGVVLTTPHDRLPAEVAAEIIRLQPREIRVVGGTGAVSDAVMRRAASLAGAPAVRLGGASRYATSASVTRKAFDSRTVDTVFIATGRDFPDALAAGPAAAHVGAPVILVDGKGQALSAETRELIRSLGARDAIIVGGTGAVNERVAASLRSLLGDENVERVAGADRFVTATAVNDLVFDEADAAVIVSANGFADAVVGAALAGKLSAPIHLSGRSCIPEDVFYEMISADTRELVLVGGTGVLDTEIEEPRACDGPYYPHFFDGGREISLF